MNVVLDPSLIWLCPYTAQDFYYLSEVVNFIDTILDISYVASNLFIEELTTYMKEPFQGYRESDTQKNMIISKIWQKIELTEMINLQQTSNKCNSLPTEFSLTGKSSVDENFGKLIKYIIDNNINCILFLALKNHSLDIAIGDMIVPIKHIYRELNSYLAQMISVGEFIKNDSIILPTINNPLPNENLCREYFDVRKEILATGGVQNTAYLEIGKEVALRNGYTFDTYLTQINNNAIRNIFTSKTKTPIYLSIDVEHGGIEVFDSKPEHQGECSYVGIYKKNSKDPIRHKIKLHK